jgi:hypothetical protein
MMNWYPEFDPSEALAESIGRRVVGASSSLTFLSVELDDGHGLLAEARTDGATPTVGLVRMPASSLPRLEEAICTVDWSWIVDSTVRAATLAEGQLRLELEPAGPLTVSAALWQGSPFLAFQPYRAPRGA